MNKFLSLSAVLAIIFCTSCTSLYLEDFDTPAPEGVKNYSLTDLERSIVEMPGDKQDVLIGLPGLTASPEVPCGYAHPIYPNKVWICDRICASGEREEGHYKFFTDEGAE